MQNNSNDGGKAAKGIAAKDVPVFNEGSVETVARNAAPPARKPAEVDPAELAARRKMATGIPQTPPAIDETTSATRPPVAIREAEPPRRAEEHSGARQGLASVVEHVDALLKDIERSKATLAQRTSALGAEREAHHEIKLRHRLLNVEQERMSGEFSALQSELEQQTSLATALEATIALLQQSLAEKTRLAADHSSRAESERQTQSDMHETIQRGKSELSSAEERVIQLESEISAAQDSAHAARTEIRKRDAEVAELRGQAERMARSLDEVRASLNGALKQAQSAEAASAQERDELTRLRGTLQLETDGRRADFASMQIKVDSFLARSESLERANAELLSELSGRSEEVRLLEKFLREQQGSSAQAQDALHAAEIETDELRARTRELEAANNALADHTDGLSRSLRAREKEGGNWKHKVDGANERLRIEAQRFEADRDSLGQTIARLTARLEQEKLARAVSEGALEAARKERQTQSRGQAGVRLVASQAEVVQLTGTHHKS